MIKPMKCKPTDTIPDNQDGNLIFEQKFDGGRGIITVKNGKVEVRHGKNPNLMNVKYPDLLPDLQGLPDGIYDGEIVVLQDGFSVFNLYQKRQCSNPFKIQLRAKKYPVTFAVFDILQCNGQDLRNLSLMQRKQKLQDILKQDRDHVKLTRFFDNPNVLLEKQQFLEGIVIKSKDSSYEEDKRSGLWRKIRFNKEDTVTVIGYELTETGIVMITDTEKRINLAGQRSKKAKELIDNNGKVRLEIVFYEETDKGYRFCSVKRILDE